MKNISIYCSKSQIKTELALVYVHLDPDNKLVAVATDSYRLAVITIPEDMANWLKPGYYEPKAWETLCKAYNKKTKDIITILNTIAGQEVIQHIYKSYNYPTYTAIIPKEEDLLPFTGSKSYNKQYFIDMLKLIPETKYKQINFQDLKETAREMLVYKDNTLTLLLMATKN